MFSLLGLLSWRCFVAYSFFGTSPSSLSVKILLKQAFLICTPEKWKEHNLIHDYPLNIAIVHVYNKIFVVIHWKEAIKFRLSINILIFGKSVGSSVLTSIFLICIIFTPDYYAIVYQNCTFLSRHLCTFLDYHL